MENINQYILDKANEAGVCEAGALGIAHAANVDELLAIYVKHIDFCLSSGFLANEDLLRLAGDRLSAHGIYIDAAVELKEQEFAVLLGTFNGKMTASGYTVAQLFVKDNSSVAVEVSGNAFVVIDCFDDAVVNVTATDDCKVLVNIYGNPEVAHHCKGNAVVKVVRKGRAGY